MPLHVIHIGNSKHIAQLLRRDFQRSWAFRGARRGLGKGGRKGRVKPHIALDLLHGLMNMPVQDGD